MGDSNTVRELLLQKYQWKRITAPKSWRPKEDGDALIGFYGGRTTRFGSYGQYECVLVHVPAVGSYMVSGTKLLQLFDAAMIDIGHPVRIVWRGMEALDGGTKHMKQFEVFVAEGEPLTSEEIAELQTVLL